MTFLEIYTEGFDRMGVPVASASAADLAMMKRFANEAAQFVAVSAKWPELDKSAAITFLTSGLTALPSWVSDVTAVLNINGRPLAMKDRRAFDDLYRGDTTAATDPLVCCVEGMDASGNLQLSHWPVIAGTRAGTVKGLRRIAAMVGDADVPEIPGEMHFLIVDRMVALYREWEESDASMVAMQRSDGGVQRVAMARASDVVRDRT